MSSLQIQFVDFGITKSQLNLFTNRHLISINTLRQVTKLKQFVKNNPNNEGIDYIEQTTRIKAINTLTGIEFKAMIEPDSIYSNYNIFFNKYKDSKILESYNFSMN